MEPEVIQAKKAKPRAKKVEVVIQPSRMAMNIRLRPIKWMHLGITKPNPAELVAVLYKLHSGLEFTTTVTLKKDAPKLEADTTTYYEDVVDRVGYFQLSFYASNQHMNDFDTMALLGERGEIIYLYEF